MSANDLLKQLKRPSVGGACVAGLGSVYTFEARMPKAFTIEMLQELAIINRAFPNSLDGSQTLFGYLSEQADLHNLGNHYVGAAGMSKIPGFLQDLSDFLERGVFDDRIAGRWTGKPTQKLYDKFRELQKKVPAGYLPIDYMSYTLNRMGQSTLPGGKLGWKHLEPFQVIPHTPRVAP